LNNSTTAFLGGKDSSQQILTFDWISLRHTKHKEELNGKRWNAACALAIGPGVNFTNVLRKPFTLTDPKSVKRYWWYWWLEYPFALLGSERVKAVSEHVGEIDPRWWAGVNYINFLRVVSSFSLITIWLCNFLAQGYWCKSCS